MRPLNRNSRYPADSFLRNEGLVFSETELRIMKIEILGWQHRLWNTDGRGILLTSKEFKLLKFPSDTIRYFNFEIYLNNSNEFLHHRIQRGGSIRP